MKLRDYQTKAVQETVAALKGGDSPILVAPTGSGKTVMGVRAANNFRSANGIVLWLAHRRELIHQAAERLRLDGQDVGLIIAEEDDDPQAAFQVASTQTLSRRKNNPKYPVPDLIVVDEAHHAVGDTYQSILATYPKAALMGLTATPFRLDGKPLGDIFDKMIVASTVSELCKKGFLTEPLVIAPATPNLTGVAKTAGDFAKAATSQIMRHPEIIEATLKAWEKHGKGRRTVGFAIDVDHVKAMTQAFRQAGHRFVMVTAYTLPEHRERAFRDLEAHKIDGIWNCQVITEGVDLPALEVAIMARPTASLCLHLQMIGRIMRVAPDKTGALVIDAAGNHHRHGFVTQPLEYSLKEAVRTKTQKGSAPVKVCPDCQAVLPIQTATCDCGHEFIKARDMDDKDRWNFLRLRPIQATELGDMQVAWNRIEAQAQQWNRRYDWKIACFKNLFGRAPMLVNGIIKDPGMSTESDKKAFYCSLTDLCDTYAYKYGWAYFRYKDAMTGGNPDTAKWGTPQVKRWFFETVLKRPAPSWFKRGK